MRTIGRDTCVYEMATATAPACAVGQGERVRFLTEDAYGGVVRTAGPWRPRKSSRDGNPATGPVAIAGALAGEVLAVRIVSIRPISPGTMLTGTNLGALGSRLTGYEVAKIPLRNGFAVVDGRRIRLRPMIGVIGVAPAGEPAGTCWPGEHGGNLDCKLITAGSVVYLPVAVDGALLALGDIHAVQADGEAAICAVETRAEVVVSARSLASPLPTPAVATRSALAILASAKTLDEAQEMVLDKTYRYLTDVQGMRGHEAVRFTSLVCDLEVCQVVDPLKTMRVTIPKKYLSR